MIDGSQCSHVELTRDFQARDEEHEASRREEVQEGEEEDDEEETVSSWTPRRPDADADVP